ncbi:hypothetical protein GCM10009681_25400 [Luedemannella helvata]|uniref:Uncharacterized protein n=2 Tax=Luedemannella helvata TaxID=349315 RepID=A0ABN2KDA5_9ACTN
MGHRSVVVRLLLAAGVVLIVLAINMLNVLYNPMVGQFGILDVAIIALPGLVCIALLARGTDLHPAWAFVWLVPYLGVLVLCYVAWCFTGKSRGRAGRH